MGKTSVLRLSGAIALLLKKEASEIGLSENTLIVKILSERYDLPFEQIGNRTPDKHFKKGELHEIIKEILSGSDDPLSSNFIADAIIDSKNLRGSSDLPEIRISISSILSGLRARKVIKKAGQIGRNNLWKLA